MLLIALTMEWNLRTRDTLEMYNVLRYIFRPLYYIIIKERLSSFRALDVLSQFINVHVLSQYI